MQRQELNKQVCKLFGEETISYLKNFSRKIDDEKPDIIVLLARKALYLFELFDYLGIKRPEGEIVSDRILELNPEFLFDKKIVIVDDALVVGTTLRLIREKLQRYKIDYKIYVFAVDVENWHRDIIMPDYIERALPSSELLDFSQKAVNAFEITSTPFQIDFPCTNFVELDEHSFYSIEAVDGFSLICLKKDFYVGYEKYTLLLDESIQNQFSHAIGNGYRSILDVSKVRIYISSTENQNMRVKFVPIVLLKEVSKTTIDRLFLFITHFIRSEDDYNLVINHIASPEIRLRFIQYFLSVCLGNFIIRTYFPSIENKITFRSTELINLFSKHLASILQSVLTKWSEINYEEYIEPTDNGHFYNLDDIFDDVSIKAYDIVSGFHQIFINLTDRREVRARQRISAGQNEDHVNARLSNGVSFEQISRYICGELGLDSNTIVRSILSIGLDICNDYGVCNPIICNSEGYYYRAFRHGELAKRTQKNIYLLYVFLKSFCEERSLDLSDGFDRLLLEKLSVLFYRIGAKSYLLDVTIDYNDRNAIQTGFYLMGAVLIENKENAFFPNDSQDWFIMNHCNGLFIKRGNKYYLDKIPSLTGLGFISETELISKLLGRTLGQLVTPPHTVRNEHIIEKALNLDRLTILVSCYSAGDLSLSLAAEQNIINNWLEQFHRRSNIGLGNGIFIESFKSTIVYQAFNQSFFKLSYSKKNGANSIITSTQEYLSSLGDKSTLDTWKLYASRLGIGHATVLEFCKIEGTEIEEHILNLFVCTSLYGIDIIYIRFLIETYYNLKVPQIAFNSIFTIRDNATQILYRRKLVKKAKKDLLYYEVGYLTDPGKAFWGKSVGEDVEVIIKGKEYSFKVVSIDNIGCICESVYILDEYFRNVVKLLETFTRGKNLIEVLSCEYEDISSRIAIIQKAQNYHTLNDDLANIIAEMMNRRSRSCCLVENAVRFYAKSRESFVTGLL